MTRLSHSIFTSLREASEGSFGNMDRFQTGNRGLSFEAAILGAYWGKELLLAEQQGRICDVPVNTDLPVHTAWEEGPIGFPAERAARIQFALVLISILDYETNSQSTPAANFF